MSHPFDLSDISRLSDARTFSISAENPRGEKGGGALAAPGDDEHCCEAARKLGKGWKVRPCLVNLQPGAVVDIADIAGPGTIQHIWITVHTKYIRRIAFRVFYDDQAHPSIETPLGDFFANGLDGDARVVSIPVAVNPRGGMNCYWPMPFRKRIRIEITNDSSEPIDAFFYQITYALHEVPDDAAYLHASWRRDITKRENPEHVILDGVTGKGHYVGTYLVWNQLSNDWWGEGEVKFFIDGDTTHPPHSAPTICGTGTEDYFGGAWGFTAAGDRDIRPATYSSPYLGYPQALYEPSAADGQRVPAHALYRWHIPDPIRFTKDLRVTIQALGWWPDRTFQPLTDDIASTAFWYQALPSQPLQPLPPMDDRWPR
ncbi:MAG: DUF2961 domain-containing protein [Phycisphaerales bacterium]|nr:MAG: DUF2961 domain-containing protein [Phycisphaerales bacterium]